jgi:uncharacterized LabA/DUF88 family protein
LSQKGVDMRIGLDIAALALKRIVQVVVLVTADTDFIPAMKFACREGLQLFLVTLGNSIHDGLWPTLAFLPDPSSARRRSASR